MENRKYSSISFHRRYHAYSGGHQKVRDYLDHTVAYNKLETFLWTENKSSLHPDLFNHIPRVNYQQLYQPNVADIIFLAGLDWQRYMPKFDKSRPKINLIQHIRHGDPQHPLHQFLKHKAIRICVSDAVREAILPYANGPCITVKMGYQLPKLPSNFENQLYILATKQPALGKQIEQWAVDNSWSVIMHDKPVARELVHSSMASSEISVVLPNKTEGFFLPGIEAMALSKWAVVPDCIASREYCLPLSNTSIAELTLESCVDAINDARKKSSGMLSRVHRWNGSRIANSYNIDNERAAYHEILRNIADLW